MTTDTQETTALAVRDESAVYAPVAVDPPREILPSKDEMMVMVQIANSVYKTSGQLIPSAIKSPEAAFAVMLAGHELGIPPMAAFREIFIVEGRTSPSARVLMGLVMKGDPGAVFDWKVLSDERATVRLTRSNGQTIEVTYTVEDANKAGLIRKNRDGSPGVWMKYTRDMLAYRAVVRACRLAGADLVTGIGASVGSRATAAIAAIESDAGTIDGEPMPQLEGEPLPPDREPVVDKKARISELIAEAAEKWQDDDGRFEAWSNGIRERFPVLADPKKIAKLTDEDADAIIEAMEADVLGVVQGSFNA